MPGAISLHISFLFLRLSGMNFYSVFKRAGNLLSSVVSPRFPPFHSSSMSHSPSILTSKSPYAIEAFNVKPRHYHEVEQATDGASTAGHPVDPYLV